MLKLLFVLPALLLFALLPQEPAATPAQATAPDAAVPLTNPVKPTPESQAHAKTMYKYDCAVCHGAGGDGKGELVADMNLKLKDWTDPAALKDIPDGTLFTIIKDGKGQMPAEADRAKPNDLWNMVILVRSFAKK